MLRGTFTNESTPFDCWQIAQMCFSPNQMLVFELQWRQLVNDVAFSNLKHSQDDPLFGAGLPQLMGNPPNNTLQLQARLYP